MTTTSPIPLPAPPRLGGPTRAAYRTALRDVAWIGGIFWVVILAVAVGVVVSNSRTVGVAESIVTSLSNTPRGFVLAMGITLVTVNFTPHVASGRTRRLLVQSSAGALAVLVLASAAIVSVGLVVERSVYEANGWPLGIRTGHLFDSTDQVGLAFVENLTVLSVFGAAGLLIGAAYRTWGAARASLALPLTASPALLALAVIELRSTSDLGGRVGFEGLSAPVSLAAFVVLAAVAYAAAARLARGAHAGYLGSGSGSSLWPGGDRDDA